jgi:DNA-binding winged helix-turn-helix (wHTH) protein
MQGMACFTLWAGRISAGNGGSMATAPKLSGDGLSFGPFNLLAGTRLLTKAGAPIELGARALDILIALTSSPNEVVSKKDLIARVWPTSSSRKAASDSI